MAKNRMWMFFLVFSFWIPEAFAYIDPGSGSAILSAMIGFFVAAGVAVKSYWYKLKSLIFRKTVKNDHKLEGHD